MKRTLIACTTALVLALLALTAAVVLDDDGDRYGMRGPGMSSLMSGDRDDDRGRGGGPAWGDMHDRMRDAMPASEEDYLAEMVAHHEEAVTAAEELSRSDRPQMRAFGESIVETQTAQIQQMNAWLDEWYDGGDEAEYEPMMRDLTGLSGDQLDRAFLQDMIGHHMMAVMMSQQLLVRGLADHDEVAELAGTIRDEQHDEIVTMTRWSRAWFGDRWRMGPGWGMGMMW